MDLSKVIDSIVANFERFLRWVYPGGLTVALLYAANPTFLKDQVYDKFGGWGMVIGGLVAGAVVYLFQAYVVSWIVTFIFILLKWDVRQGLQVGYWPRVPVGTVPSCCRTIMNVIKRMLGYRVRQCMESLIHCLKQMVDTNPVCCLIPFTRVFDRMAAATARRWQPTDSKGLENYLNYAWATYHAVLITGWLPIFFYCIKKDGSVLEESHEWAVLLPAIMLLVGGVIYYALLTRIRWR
jgi:hypothetical protein